MPMKKPGKTHTFSKSLATVRACWPKRRSEQMPTQFLPAMAITAPPLYCRIDCEFAEKGLRGSRGLEKVGKVSTCGPLVKYVGQILRTILV